MTILERVEGMAAWEPPYDMYERLAAVFGEEGLDEITDFDNEESLELSFLVSLNRDRVSLSSEALDPLLETGDAYFLAIDISREKALATRFFWRYPQGGGGQQLEISEEAFLPEQAAILDLFQVFADDNDLLVLTKADLEEKIAWEGREVSLHFKYFHRNLSLEEIK